MDFSLPPKFKFDYSVQPPFIKKTSKYQLRLIFIELCYD